jgi:hypothetical protein
MRIEDLYESLTLGSSNDVWYHGSPRMFTKFDLNATKLNRGSNPSGIYLTKNLDLAKRYAGPSGFVYKVQPKIKNTYVDKKTKITERLANSYKSALMKYTTYQSDWIDVALIPSMYEKNQIKGDIDGEVKTATYVGAGYDSYIFMDMFDHSLVVFDPKNVKIVAASEVSKL